MEKEKTYERHLHEPSEVPSIKITVIEEGNKIEEVQMLPADWEKTVREKHIKAWGYPTEIADAFMEDMRELTEGASESIADRIGLLIVSDAVNNANVDIT